jgi:hypothetical protein
MKWLNRTSVTRVRRTAYNTTVNRIHHLYLEATFRAMKHNYFYNKELAKRIGNLANVCNNIKLLLAYNAVKSFSRAKGFVHSKRKENSTIWLAEALQGLYYRKL